MMKVIGLLKDVSTLALGAWLAICYLWLAGKIDGDTARSVWRTAVGLAILAQIIAALLKRWDARRADKA
jgi:hypothetical protein